MNKEMLELAEWSLKIAKSAGADDARVSISGERFVEISYRQQKPETIKEASKKGLYIEIFANKRYSGQSTSDLRKDALTTFITNSVAMTKLLAEDEFRTLPDPKYYAGREEMDLGIADPAYGKMTAESRHDIAKQIEDTCLSKGGEKVVSVTAAEYDSHDESLKLSTNGFEGYRESTVYYAGAEMTVQDEGDRRPNGYNYMASRNRNSLPAPDKIGEITVQRTMELLGAKKLKTETLPIIIENRGVSRVLGGLMQAMNGGNIQQKRSFLADKKGEKIAGDLLTIIDDPFIKGGLGSRLFDGDGFAAKKRILIENGVVKEFLVDWYRSRKLGWEPTGGSTSNLLIPPGTRSVAEIMKDLGRGILINGFIGGNSNPVTGDSSVGITGQLFEDGQPVQAIAEMNIADNHLQFWQKLAEVANDPWIYSSWRMPSLVFTDVVVAGV